MCGIAGILNLDGAPVPLDDVRRMTDAMVHRGPDDEGFHLDAGVGLGMRRLAIIDLETGHQPLANETGRIVVVANGEIYNHRELRRRLEARGHRFATRSDCEVIVHLYEEHGPGCVEHLRGMFGFALWDGEERQLLLARDRLGIKPLYWARTGRTLAFGSELKAILALPEVPREIDWTAVDHLFSFLTTPADRSLVEGVRKLEPGRLLLAREGTGQPEIRRWWQVRFEPDRSRSEDRWVEDLRAALVESAELHQVSDVPVGAFLSGGVDSSAVVAAMSHSRPEPVRTFSIGFREAEFDELEHARTVARAIGCSHREEVVEPDVAEILEDLCWHLDEPFGDSSAIPTWVVSRLAAEDVTVVLSGDGGDELFAGYDRYVVEGRERWNRFLPAPVRSLLRSVGDSLPPGTTGRELIRHLSRVGADRYLDAGTYFKDDEKDRLFRPEIRARMADADPRARHLRLLESSDEHWLSALQRLDLETYLPLDILTKVDRMSMAHSIETRVPLLDHPLVELAARIPPELQMKGGRTKHLLKRALEGWIPDAILERPKAGFAIPLGHWFRGRLGPLVREVLQSGRSRSRGVFSPEAVASVLELHERGRPLDLQIWILLSFELWCRRFLDRSPVPVSSGERRPAVGAPAGAAASAARRVPTPLRTATAEAR